MDTAEIHYRGNLRTSARHIRSGDTVTTDAPVDNNGRGEAFSPTDLLSASLVSCMITIIGIQAQKRDLAIGNLHGTVEKIMAENPRRVARLNVHLHFDGHNLTPDERRTLEHAALNCPVAKSIHPDIHQNVEFHYFPLSS